MLCPGISNSSNQLPTTFFCVRLCCRHFFTPASVSRPPKTSWRSRSDTQVGWSAHLWKKTALRYESVMPGYPVLAATWYLTVLTRSPDLLLWKLNWLRSARYRCHCLEVLSRGELCLESNISRAPTAAVPPLRAVNTKSNILTPQSFSSLNMVSWVLLPLILFCVQELQMPQMVENNEDPKMTAFTVTVDAKRGVSTGISAGDRAITLRALSDSKVRKFPHKRSLFFTLKFLSPNLVSPANFLLLLYCMYCKCKLMLFFCYQTTLKTHVSICNVCRCWAASCLEGFRPVLRLLIFAGALHCAQATPEDFNRPGHIFPLRYTVSSTPFIPESVFFRMVWFWYNPNAVGSLPCSSVWRKKFRLPFWNGFLRYYLSLKDLLI